MRVFSALRATIFCVVFILAGASPSWALRDGFLGWTGWNGNFADPVAACADYWQQCKVGCGPLGSKLGPDSQFLGAQLLGPRRAACVWTTYQWGCKQGGDCGTILPPLITSDCGGNYSTRGYSSCYTSAQASPSNSCKSNGNPWPGVSNPIELGDGAKVESVIDFKTGDGELVISREYRSLVLEDTISRLWAGPLGVLNIKSPTHGAVGGWQFNFQMELRVQINSPWATANSVTLYLPNGVPYEFIYSGSGTSFTPWSGGVQQGRYKVDYLGALPLNWSVIWAGQSTWQVTDTVENRVWVLKSFPEPGTSPVEYQVARPVSMNKGGYAWTLAYDANGYLQTLTDSFGRSLGFTWNKFVYPVTANATPLPVTIQSISLPTGGKLQYTYDPPLKSDGSSEMLVRRLVKADQYNSSGTIIETVSYQYENTLYPDFLTGITDARGVRYATFTYDTEGHAIASEHSGGQDKTTVAYSQAANGDLVRTVTNPLGKVATYTFQHPGNVNKTSLKQVDGQASANCIGSTRGYTYDANGWVATETDEEGRVTAYVRDANNRPISITRGSGTAQAVTTTLTWHPTLNVATQIVEPGRTTNVTVDTSGRITQIQKVDTTTQSTPYSTNGQTRTTTYGYNASGRLTSVDGPLAGTADTVAYAYNAAGNIQSITNEMGKVTTVTAWNQWGQPTSITDPNGNVTTLAYTRSLLSQVVVDATGTPVTTNIAYDAIGQVIQITLPNGAYETYAYDNARRLTTITNSAGETINYTRNANGDATSVTVNRANATTAYSRTRAFDELGRIIRSIGAGSQTYQFAYDKTDNLKTVTDPRSNAFSYGFDPLNRLISETDEESKTVALTRDGTNAVTAYQDARSLTTTYVRNGFDDVIQEVSPDRGTITYWRDARGLVTQRTDARGVTTNYAYDNSGRLTNKSYAGQSAYWQSFNWDATAPDNKGVGHLVGIYSEAGTNWRAFDAKGRIWIDYRTNNPAPVVNTQYRYDNAGNISGIMYPSGRIVNYVRDAMGRVSSVTTQQNSAAVTQTVVWNLVWNPYGPLASMSFGYGGVSTFTTDTDYRITRVQTGATGNLGGTIDRSLSWTGDIVNSIVDNVNPGTTPPFTYTAQSQSFTYTPTRRLASASGYYGALSWTYDANGNRASETANGATSTYAYPAGSNRLTSVTPAGGTARAFTYDASGDILTDSRTGALGMTFQYDVEGRLSKAYQTGAPAQGGTYAYDAQDRLASRTFTSGSTTTTTLYVHDINDHIIAETDTAGVTRREYIWLNDLPIAVVDNVNTATPTLYYVHTDHLGRPARMLAQNWSWVWDVIYSPFGGVSSIWDSTSKLDMRFPGQWFQLESGLAYNWHRHYDATLGRYIQPDPLRADEKEGKTVGGVIPLELQPRASLVQEILEKSPVRLFGVGAGIIAASSPLRSVFADGPTLFGYATQKPLSVIDLNGLQPKDQRFGLPKLFWRWYHREVKLPGDADLCYEEACELHDEWCRLGKP
ncbi:RHS repeat protein (plasmid) [Methylocystis parvus]|uniref:RHS repeat protein n=1 Tax=Methylocystis parvus TaxID=134 RepID=A0A6B8M782_9HYPH|nr:RHS repeat protein [Methylocystis parvus]